MLFIRSLWVKHPLMFVLVLGLILRLISAFVSKGYLMHDDHFLVIEAASSWAHGTDYNHWLPETIGNQGPEGHSFFYVGIHYLLFKSFLAVGLENPQVQMLVIRILHAFYSLLIIFFGYKIAYHYGSRDQAKLVGLILAVLFILPNFSVRNLVEVVCIPPLMAAVYWLATKQDRASWRSYIIAGILSGIAVGIRYQAGLIPLGLGLVILIFEKNFKGFLIYGFASALSFFLTQLPDLFIWHRPFAELTEYIRYNFIHGSSYFQSPWYTYLLTIAGALIPPVSFFLLFGFVREWKRLRYLVLPSFLFLLVHSLIVNKQERFILPIIPFIIIAGVIGWYNYVDKSKFWENRKSLHKICWGFFWVLNTALLTVATLSYGKKARVEAMSWIYDHGAPNYIVEYSFRDEIRYPPQFYSGYWGPYVSVNSSTKLESLKENLPLMDNPPEYVLFYESNNHSERIKQFNELIPIEFEDLIEPSFLDKTLHRLNPKNRIELVHIYRIMGDAENPPAKN